MPLAHPAERFPVVNIPVTSAMKDLPLSSPPIFMSVASSFTIHHRIFRFAAASLFDRPGKFGWHLQKRHQDCYSCDRCCHALGEHRPLSTLMVEADPDNPDRVSNHSSLETAVDIPMSMQPLLTLRVLFFHPSSTRAGPARLMGVM